MIVRPRYFRTARSMSSLRSHVAIAALCLLVTLAQAQFATVQGTVQTQSKVRVPGATVNVRDASGKVAHRKAGDDGVFTIDDLRPGIYGFVACLFPYWPQDLKMTSTRIKADQNKPINLWLEKSPFQDAGGAPQMEIPFNADSNNDGYIYLMDKATGCVLYKAPINNEGRYKFNFLETAFEVCIRRRGDAKDDEGYTCHPTSH
jgi:hypothetical protein